jgi:hypothetical protein
LNCRGAKEKTTKCGLTDNGQQTTDTTHMVCDRCLLTIDRCLL